MKMIALSTIALSAVKVIALSKAKMIAVLKFNQQDNSDRTVKLIVKIVNVTFMSSYLVCEELTSCEIVTIL
jgi:hypothetical protein